MGWRVVEATNLAKGHVSWGKGFGAARVGAEGVRTAVREAVAAGCDVEFVRPGDDDIGGDGCVFH